MSGLSTALKALLGGASPRPPARSSVELGATIERIRWEATEKGLAMNAWLAIVMAVTMTAGSSESMAAVSKHLARTLPPGDLVKAVEFLREVGIICMAMNGAPQTMVLLHAFRESLPSAIGASLRETPSRHTGQYDAAKADVRGRELWSQIHKPLAAKVEQKFGHAHPDLPSLIIRNVYGDLFSSSVCVSERTVGRITISLSAIACLRSRSGFASQVQDHIYGLRNAWTDGSWRSELHIGSEGSVEWLLSDCGCMWVLEKVDQMVEGLGSGSCSTARRARL